MPAAIPAKTAPKIGLRFDGPEIPARTFLDAAGTLLALLGEVGRSLPGATPIDWQVADFRGEDATATGVAPSVALRLDWDAVPADGFLEAAKALLEILSEVGRSLSDRKTVSWCIAHFDGGGSAIALRPAAEDDPAHAAGVITATVCGLAEMDASTLRPAHFSDKALRFARRLGAVAGQQGAGIELSASGGPAGERVQVLSGRIEAHGRQMLRRPREYGSVEGTLGALTIHGRNAFSVYDAITGKRIECVCDRETIEEVIQHLGKRVSVSGELRYGSDEEPKKVLVEDFRLLGVGPLPQAEDVRGLFADDPVDIEEWSRYVRER